MTISALFSLQDDPRSPIARALTAAVAVLLLAVGLSRGHYDNEAVDEIARVAGEIGTVESLTVLTSHVYAGPPAAIAVGAAWASRYPALWLVPGATNGLADTDCAVEPEPVPDTIRLPGAKSGRRRPRHPRVGAGPDRCR